MSKYATQKQFGGQRASVGLPVVAKVDGIVSRAHVDNIQPNDTMWISVPLHGLQTDELTFVETKTEVDIEAMPDGSWTWPVRV